MLMKNKDLGKEAYLLLLENSLGSIPFNILIASLLTLDLWYRGLSLLLILTWYASMVMLSGLRWFYSYWVIKKEYYLSHSKASSSITFLSLTFLTGAIWGVSYLLFSPYLNELHQTTIILILGGMAAGSVAAFSAYIPAFYAYVIPIFLPVIIINFLSLESERIIFAMMFLFFILLMGIIAKMNNRLINRVFQLGNQKDSLIDQLLVSNQKLEAFNKEIQVMSITDSLTGLFNRRYFDTTFPIELANARRNKQSLGLILVDVDNFKYLNDTFGHPYGDEYLIFIASVLKESMRRESDVLVRLGGDEFAAILVNMEILEIKALSDSIKERFTKENKHPNITLSIGIISIEPGNNADMKHIISAADKMLYKAKEQGKNQIISQSM